MKLCWEIDCSFWNIQRPSSSPDLVSYTFLKSHCSSSNTSSFGGHSKVPLPSIPPSILYKLLLNLSVFKSDGSQWPSMRWCEVEFFHITLDSFFQSIFKSSHLTPSKKILLITSFQRTSLENLSPNQNLPIYQTRDQTKILHWSTEAFSWPFFLFFYYLNMLITTANDSQ